MSEPSEVETSEAKRAAALADWESATVKNFGPYLDEQQSERIWAAMLAYRTSGDLVSLADDFHSVTATMFDPGVNAAASAAIDQLRTLIAAHAATE